MQKQLLSARKFFLHIIRKNKKWGEICYDYDCILNFAGFLRVQWKKTPFAPKRPPKKVNFWKNFNILIFFHPEALSYSLKVQISQNRRKIWQRSTNQSIFPNNFIKKCFFENFPQKVFLRKNFWTFIIISYSWTKSTHSSLFSAF